MKAQMPYSWIVRSYKLNYTHSLDPVSTYAPKELLSLIQKLKEHFLSQTQFTYWKPEELLSKTGQKQGRS